MSYPETNLLPIDIHFIKENLTDRIQVKNVAELSMQEICVDVTDLVKDNAEFNLLDEHRVYFTFNRLSRLSDPEIKERVLSKSYPNAMRILSDEVFHILNNYVTIPGSIYEIYMIEMVDNAYITRHEFEPGANGRSYEYNLIVELFNTIIDNIPDKERFLSYAGADFRTFDSMTTMKLTTYNAKEITQWIYDAMDTGSYIVDLREIKPDRHNPRNGNFIVIIDEEKQHVIREIDIVVKADNKIYITHQDVYDELFVPSPFGVYNWDHKVGTVIRRYENYRSYYHYNVIGLIDFIEASTDPDNPFPTEEGNWEGITIVVPNECTDKLNYPKIYIDDNETPTYEGVVNMPVDEIGRIMIKMKFSEDKLSYKHLVKWSDEHSDTVVFDATEAVLLTKEETTEIRN